MGGQCRLGVGRRESGGKASPRARIDWAAKDRVVAAQGLCGRDRIRTCVGNAGDFTVRSAGSSRVPRHPRLVPDYRRDVHETACRQLRSSPGVPARSALSRAAWRRAERKWSEIPWARARAGTGPRSIASAVRLASDIAPRPSLPFCDRRRKAATQAEIQPRRRTGRDWRQPRPRTPELFLACSSTRVVATLTETVKL
jgi:hypothetical protein